MGKKFGITGTAYRPMWVWDLQHHEVELRVIDGRDPSGTRWKAQGAVHNAASLILDPGF